jgi:hypothetical protein
VAQEEGDGAGLSPRHVHRRESFRMSECCPPIRNGEGDIVTSWAALFGLGYYGLGALTVLGTLWAGPRDWMSCLYFLGAARGVSRPISGRKSTPSDRDPTTEINVRYIFIFWLSTFYENNSRFYCRG